jgi:uncharacterized protein YhfF
MYLDAGESIDLLPGGRHATSHGQFPMTENRDTAVSDFWRSFVDATGIEGPYLAEAFGSDAETADELGRLVRDGQKRATTSLLSSYEEDYEPLPAVGDLSIVLDGRGTPLCVIRTISVDVRPFGLVDEAFAWVEGEGDRSLAYWRDAHVRFFASLGTPIDDDTMVVLDTFELLWSPSE